MWLYSPMSGPITYLCSQKVARVQHSHVCQGLCLWQIVRQAAGHAGTKGMWLVKQRLLYIHKHKPLFLLFFFTGIIGLLISLT